MGDTKRQRAMCVCGRVNKRVGNRERPTCIYVYKKRETERERTGERERERE